MPSHLYIIIGAYGSGKSEYSIHLARRFKTQGLDVVLADLDVVNPYFRSREMQDDFIGSGTYNYSDLRDNQYMRDYLVTLRTPLFYTAMIYPIFPRQYTHARSVLVLIFYK